MCSLYLTNGCLAYVTSGVLDTCHNAMMMQKGFDRTAQIKYVEHKQMGAGGTIISVSMLRVPLLMQLFVVRLQGTSVAWRAWPSRRAT